MNESSSFYQKDRTVKSSRAHEPKGEQTSQVPESWTNIPLSQSPTDYSVDLTKTEEKLRKALDAMKDNPYSKHEKEGKVTISAELLKLVEHTETTNGGKSDFDDFLAKHREGMMRDQERYRELVRRREEEERARGIKREDEDEEGW